MIKRLIIILYVFMIPAVLFAHGGHKHVMGSVASVNATTLMVKTSTGNVSVPLSKSTKVYRGSGTGQPATLAEIKRGMRVVAHLDGNGTAVEVHIPKER